MPRPPILPTALTLFLLGSPAIGQNLLNQPESVEYDQPRTRYLVSNHASGEIVQIASDGSQTYFNTELPSTRGLMILDGILYAVCDSGVVAFELETGSSLWSLNIPAMTFPNDVAADSAGNIYLTDYVQNTDGGGVWQVALGDRSYSLLAGGQSYPNGIMYDHGNRRLLTCGGHPTARITAISLPDGTVTTPTFTPFGALDGIAADHEGNVYVSNWQNNSVYRYRPSLIGTPLFFSGGHDGPADIFYDRCNHRMCVPCYYPNRVDFLPVSIDRFHRETDLAPATDPGNSWSANWIDYDNDEYPDLFVTNLGSNNCLYRNNADGTFSKQTGCPLVNDYTGGINAAGASWADMDNDGDVDAFVATFREGDPPVNRGYRNDGAGVFTPLTGTAVVADPGMSIDPSWIDYDNDGDLDLYVANHNEVNYLYRNDGQGFVRITEGTVATDYSEANSACWADYDSDGDQDLFVANAWGDSRDFLYENQGGSFSRVASGGLVTAVRDSWGGSWGDYDNDGDPDLMVTHSSWGYPATSYDSLYRNNGDGTFSSPLAGQPPVSNGAYSFGSTWGDFDNDADLDLFVAVDGPNLLYENLGDGTFALVSEGRVVTDSDESLAGAWADYDRDGDLDLYVTNNGSNALYRNNGSGNAWLNIRCIGTTSNRSAIGARIRVKASVGGNPVWQLREISSKTGKSGQNSLRAHFGLGDAVTVDSIMIAWPGGAVEVLENTAVNQFLTLTEGDYSDLDGDGWIGIEDNCPTIANPGQEDADGEGPGDACCCSGRVGDANLVGGDEPTIGDVSVLIDHLFITGVTLGCPLEADINQSGGTNPTQGPGGDISIGDVSVLIDYLFITGQSLGLPPCL